MWYSNKGQAMVLQIVILSVVMLSTLLATKTLTENVKSYSAYIDKHISYQELANMIGNTLCRAVVFLPPNTNLFCNITLPPTIAEESCRVAYLNGTVTVGDYNLYIPGISCELNATIRSAGVGKISINVTR